MRVQGDGSGQPDLSVRFAVSDCRRAEIMGSGEFLDVLFALHIDIGPVGHKQYQVAYESDACADERAAILIAVTLGVEQIGPQAADDRAKDNPIQNRVQCRDVVHESP